MNLKILLAAGALAISATSFAAVAQAKPSHHGHYGYGAVIDADEDEAPAVVVVPQRTGVYFKRALVGTRDVVQQCFKRRAWTSTGELFWSEVCQ